ncbi:MAG: glycosyltransferase family 2 protein [Burkholderiaceae bacterium]|nr:glycosyltransferase family 2 protein [Burkholderiaceae bacterium]
MSPVVSGNAPAPTPTLTVAVLTHNEAHCIDACLRSASFADHLQVVDSGSTDDTVARARAAGAQVFVEADWQGFAVQRTRQLAHVQTDYVFFLDADEVMSPEFQQELQAVVRSGSQSVWQVRWRMVAFGRELRYLRASTKVERLFRRDQIQGWKGVVHEQAVLRDSHVPRQIMRTPLLHHSRSSVRASLEKMTQYAQLGAAKRAAQGGQRGGVVRGLLAGGAMFLRLYVLRLGFLCGGAGFLYCLCVALEAFFRYAALFYDRETLTDRVGR